MSFNLQIQFGGQSGTQIIQEKTAQSFSRLLIEVANSLKERTFTSEEVQNYLFDCIDSITNFLNSKTKDVLNTSKYVVFPFQAIAIDETLQDQGYVRSVLDTLSVIAFTKFKFNILPKYINIKIEDKNIFGMYYTNGQLNLIDSYTRLLKNMSDKKIPLPGAFVCIPLNTSGTYTLDENKINNIVTNIVGDSDYIKPLRTGRPKCLSLSSYIISEAQSVADARAHIKKVLGLE